MAVSLTSVDVSQVPRDGGYLIKLTGSFVSGEIYRVYIGPSGDSTDPLCLSGVAGQQSDIYPLNITSLWAYTPVMDAGGPYDIYVREVDSADNDTLAAAMTAVESDYKTKVEGYRSLLPPFYHMGPRNMGALHNVGTAKSYPIGLLEALSGVLGEADNEIGGLHQTRLTSAVAVDTDIAAVLTWDGTTTITTPDTSEVVAGDWVKLDVNGQWFEITSLIPNTSILILNPDSLTIPTGVTASSKAITSLPIESAHNWPTSGKVGVDGVVYHFASRTQTTIDGLTHILGGGTIPGLLRAHKQQTTVVDLTLDQSAIDSVRRAMLVDYAEGEDLSALGRNYGVLRLPFITDDDQFRDIIKYLAYNPRGTIYGIELALIGLLGAGNFEIIEDLITYPNTVFINITGDAAADNKKEGKTFVGSDVQVVSLTDPDAADVNGEPVARGSVSGMTWLDEDHVTDCRSQKPSADSFVEATGHLAVNPWTYEGVDEAVDVTLTADSHIEIVDNTGANQPIYRHNMRIQPESRAYAEVTFMIPSTASLNATTRNFELILIDGGKRLSFGVKPNGGNFDIGFSTGAGSFIDGAAATLNYDTWYTFGIRKNGDAIALLSNRIVVKVEDRSNFTTPADTHPRCIFGCNDTVSSGARARVKQVSYYAHTHTDYWAARGITGAVLTAAATNFDTNSLDMIAGDVGKTFVITGSAVTNPEGGNNNGRWKVATYVDTDNVTLEGTTEDDAVLESASPVRVTVPTTGLQFQYPDDLGKEITISGSAASNDGTYVISKLLDPGTFADLDDGWSPVPAKTNVCEVKNTTPPGGVPSFTTEVGLSWKLGPVFINESNLSWELSDAGVSAPDEITLRQDTPIPIVGGFDPLLMRLTFSKMLSAQLLKDASIANVLLTASPLVFQYYPAYISDPLGFVRIYLDDVTAAGVIPDYTLT